jgi:hypothetical protein
MNINIETKKLLQEIIENQNILSLAIRRVLPSGNTETIPMLDKIEKSNKELLDKLSK